MKKVAITALALVFTIGAFAAGIATMQDKPVSPSQLPAQVQQFITTHFGSDVSIVYAEKDWTKYEVRLSNGYEVDFNLNGQWRKVDAKRAGIPASIMRLVPADIATYVENNHRGYVVTELKKKRYGYDLEIRDPQTGDDVELEFSSQGKLIKIDY